jgi:ubiquinone biosynthesis UbiH/UbiF/VisC/COQ6 family hydroxylase
VTAPAYDLIIAGGGLIGAAAALGAARAGRSALLLDRAQPQPIVGRFGMDIRNVSISPGSRALLESLSVWDQHKGAPFTSMRVWEEQGTAILDFAAADVGRDELGWIVENGTLVSALWQALKKTSGVTVQVGESISAVHEHADQITVTTDKGEYSAGLLVAADGATSTVRQLLKVKTSSFPTGHYALVTLLDTEAPHQGVANQRFLHDGPLALLPSLLPNRVSVVWSQSETEALRRKALTEADFCREITEASEAVLGQVTAADDRFCFPLVQHLAESFNPRQRVVLLGDAARVLHPLAGLGANAGFEDVRDFLDRLHALPVSGDPGTAGMWNRFARHRRARAALLLTLMSTLRRVYAEDDPYLQWLRNLGVNLTMRSGPIRQQVIREALGLGALAA